MMRLLFWSLCYFLPSPLLFLLYLNMPSSTLLFMHFLFIPLLSGLFQASALSDRCHGLGDESFRLLSSNCQMSWCGLSGTVGTVVLSAMAPQGRLISVSHCLFSGCELCMWCFIHVCIWVGDWMLSQVGCVLIFYDGFSTNSISSKGTGKEMEVHPHQQIKNFKISFLPYNIKLLVLDMQETSQMLIDRTQTHWLFTSLISLCHSFLYVLICCLVFSC